MDIRTKEIAKPAGDARTAAARISDLAKNDKLTPEQTKEALSCFEKLYDNVMVLAEKMTREGQVSEFGKFFSAVGDSLVRAQTEMDRKSAVYIEETRNHPHALPSTFRIPKISADIKFALQSVQGSKVNLLFYSKHKQSQEQHEQRLKFDIVAAPPPPEITEKILKRTLDTGALPAVSFISNPVDRKKILTAIIDTTKGIVRRLFKQNADRVLIVENRAGNPAENAGDNPPPDPDYFVLLANPKAAGQSDEDAHKNTGVWHLSFQKDGRPEFKVVYSYFRKPADSEIAGAPIFYKALMKMCDDQETFLKRL